MIGDLYNVVCSEPMFYGKFRLGLACGCSLVVLEANAQRTQMACMNLHPGYPPATPPPGGWPKVAPPPPPDSWGGDKEYD